MTTSTAALPIPKAFLSYCHTSPEYVERIVNLAEELVSHGVQVVFDQWDLREGHDLHAFMEQAVGDSTVTHVLILCDPMYAEKANGRRGGVGTETLILSPAVYGDVNQERVVPVIMARDEDDCVQVPTYLNTRRYIDLSNDERMAENYEQLVRTLYKRPARVRPALGTPPAFLDEQYVPLQTAGPARLARAALHGHRPDGIGRLTDYFDSLVAVVAAEDIAEVLQGQEEVARQILLSIDRFRPYRDEFVGILRDAARYAGDRLEVYDRLHTFFERVATMRFHHQRQRFDESVETENLAFIGWELLVGATAVLLRQDQFTGLGRLLRPLYVTSRYGQGALRPLDILDPGFRLLQWYYERQGSRWAEPTAQLLRERNDETSIPFEALMEADLLLWYRTAIDTEVEGGWYPRTLAYTESMSHLPLFARARSSIYFSRLAPALGVAHRAEFIQRFKTIQEDSIFPIGRAMRGRSAYQRLLGIRPDEL